MVPPITQSPQGLEEAPSPRRGFFFSGFGFRGTLLSGLGGVLRAPAEADAKYH
jgi:hypothetical protein